MTNKILLASNSSLLTSIFSKVAKDYGYDVIIAKDGGEAISLLYKEKPNCVIAQRNIPVVDGFGLSRLIKNNAETKDIVVIILSSEESRVDYFWKEHTLCDVLYIPSADNIDSIFTHIGKLLIAQNASRKQNQNLSSKQPELSDYMKYMYNSFNKEVSNLYYVNSAFNNLERIYSLENIGQMFIQGLSGVFNYDVAGLIINGIDIFEFYDKSDRLSDDEFKEFVLTSQKDFEITVPERKDYKWNKNTTVMQFHSNQEITKIKSYELFTPTTGSEIAVTIHIGTSKEQALSEYSYERLQFFINTYSKLIEISIQYNKARLDSSLLRQSFTRMLPDKIINQIVDQSNTAVTNSSERRKVAVMICDIRKFTTLSECNKPEDLVFFLNSQYFTPLCRIIKEKGGTTDKFMGDAIMSLFGAPDSYMDNCDRVCTAAIESVKRLKEVDTSIISLPEKYKFNVGFGIHYGEMISGFVHSEDKIEYTVIGDNVNLASRVEGLTKLYGVHIIITEYVRKDLHKEYNLRYLDNVVVKGKSEPVKIYELRSNEEVYNPEFIANYTKGMNQYIMGNWNTAISYFEKALQIDPNDGPAKFTLSRCKNYQAGINLDQWDSIKHAYIPSSK